MLKLKLQYFSYLMCRTDLLEKTLMLEKIEGRRQSRWQRTRLLDGITESIGCEFGEGQRSQACCSPRGHGESDMTEWLNNNKDLADMICKDFSHSVSFTFLILFLKSLSWFCCLKVLILRKSIIYVFSPLLFVF